MNITRHMGSIAGTGTRVIVVFREVPDEADQCLVIHADSLPESMRDAVSHVVSHTGQNTKDLFEALHRERMPNGENMLGALDKYGLLVKKPTESILMHPTRDYSLKLSDLNDQLRAQSEPFHNEADLQKKFNPYQEKAEHLDNADAQNIAGNLMIQADDMEADAKRKRAQAFKLRPELEEAFNKLHAVKPAPIDPTLWDDEVAMNVYNELMNRFGSVAFEPTGFNLELKGISQRKATELLKDAWAIANPSKVKK